MIENLPDELYQLESKQEKSAKLKANFVLELDGEKCSKTYFTVLERQYAKRILSYWWEENKIF